MLDISKIDWNKLSPEEFSQINAKLVENKRIVKQQDKKTERTTGFVAVQLRGKMYQIRQTEYQKLIAFRSQKSKEKFIERIISEYNPIEEL